MEKLTHVERVDSRREVEGKLIDLYRKEIVAMGEARLDPVAIAMWLVNEKGCEEVSVAEVRRIL